MNTLSPSAILNMGSVATIIALPLLHAASFGDSGPALAAGLILVAFGMAAPFVARRRAGKPDSGA